MVPVNSLSGEGVEDLLEALVLVADENEIVGNAERHAAWLGDRSRESTESRGTMATLLVMNGTMKRGESIVAGTSYGRGQSHV